MTAYTGKTRTTLGQLHAALWDSQLRSGCDRACIRTRVSVVMPLDCCATRELVRMGHPRPVHANQPHTLPFKERGIKKEGHKNTSHHDFCIYYFQYYTTNPVGNCQGPLRPQRGPKDRHKSVYIFIYYNLSFYFH